MVAQDVRVSHLLLGPWGFGRSHRQASPPNFPQNWEEPGTVLNV